MKRRLKLILVFTLLALPAMSSAVPISASLSGKIVDWPAGKTGEIHVENLNGSVNIATSPVSQDGQFRLKLPATLEGIALGESGSILAASSPDDDCQGEGTVTPADSRMRTYRLAGWMDSKPLGDITLDSSARMYPRTGDAGSTLVYFSVPTVMKGKVTCPAPFNNSVYQGSYPAGWSLVRQNLTVDARSGQTTVKEEPSAALTGLSWRLYREFGGVGMNLTPGTRTVESVRPNSPAEKAGLWVGDEITSVDGKEVKSMQDILNAVRGDPDTKVKVTVNRAGASRPLTLEITRGLIRVP